jgi:CHAD domain-containing protein
VTVPPPYDWPMESSLERELKLEPPDGFQFPPLEGAELPTRHFTSAYYDTPPRSLAHAGITLRRRLENGVSHWQLKLPRGADARAEIQELGGPAGPPDALRSLLTAHLRHGELEKIATLRTRRSGVRVTDGERAVADVTLDNVSVVGNGAGRHGFDELEIELVDGDERDLKRLGRTLRRAGARRSDGRPKVLRVVQLAAVAEVHPDAPTVEHIQSLLAGELRELERYDPGVRTADDPEDLHRFRVATRRTRALVRATQPLLGDRLEPLADELKWLASVLGPVRDLDVLLGDLAGAVAELGDDGPQGRRLLGVLERERRVQRRRLAKALDSKRYLGLLDLFGAQVAALAGLKVSSSLLQVAKAEFKKLEKEAKELPADPSDEQLHAVRIRAKRARYAAEFVGIEELKRYVIALKQVQDVVGEHQDAVVAQRKLRESAGETTALAAGRLIERQRTRQLERRAAYPAVLDTALRSGRKSLG